VTGEAGFVFAVIAVAGGLMASNRVRFDIVALLVVLALMIISLDPLFFSMAVILAFGLIFGTILTLGVVPALYAVLFRARAA